MLGLLFRCVSPSKAVSPFLGDWSVEVSRSEAVQLLARFDWERERWLKWTFLPCYAMSFRCVQSTRRRLKYEKGAAVTSVSVVSRLRGLW